MSFAFLPTGKKWHFLPHLQALAYLLISQIHSVYSRVVSHTNCWHVYQDADMLKHASWSAAESWHVVDITSMLEGCSWQRTSTECRADISNVTWVVLLHPKIQLLQFLLQHVNFHCLFLCSMLNGMPNPSRHHVAKQMEISVNLENCWKEDKLTLSLAKTLKIFPVGTLTKNMNGYWPNLCRSCGREVYSAPRNKERKLKVDANHFNQSCLPSPHGRATHSCF